MAVLINHHQSWWCTFHGNLFPLKIHCCFCFVKEVVPLPLFSQTCWYRRDGSWRENPAVHIQFMDKTLPFTLMVIVGSRGRLSPAELSWYPVVFCTLTEWGIHCALTVNSSKKESYTCWFCFQPWLYSFSWNFSGIVLPTVFCPSDSFVELDDSTIQTGRSHNLIPAFLEEKKNGPFRQWGAGGWQNMNTFSQFPNSAGGNSSNPNFLGCMNTLLALQ